MKISNITPSKFRIILILMLVLIVGAHVGVVYVGLEKLKSSSESVSESVKSSLSSGNELNELMQAEKILSTKSKSIKASEDLVAKIKDRASQNDIIYDTISYGNKAGIGIKGFTFTDDLAKKIPGARSTGSLSKKKKTIPGVTSHPITITTISPVDYMDLLRLLKYIEGNLTQIHLQNINVSAPQEGKNKNLVEASTLNVEVYTK